jgi:hypothetical protein
LENAAYSHSKGGTIDNLVRNIDSQLPPEQRLKYRIEGGALIKSLIISDPKRQEKHGSRRAIIIGINKYKAYPEILTLTGPENDAKEVHRQLIKLGNFDISSNHFLIGSRATRTNIMEALSEIFRREVDCDVVVFYFSGHGMVDDVGQGYIAPYDMKPGL